MNPFIYLVSEIIQIYSMILFAWVVLGILIYFKIVNAYQPLVRKIEYALSRLVEPALRPIRRVLPDLGGIDISPVILILLLDFLKRAIWYYF